jgi:hypothetical protein
MGEVVGTDLAFREGSSSSFLNWTSQRTVVRVEDGERWPQENPRKISTVKLAAHFRHTERRKASWGFLRKRCLLPWSRGLIGRGRERNWGFFSRSSVSCFGWRTEPWAVVEEREWDLASVRYCERVCGFLEGLRSPGSTGIERRPVRWSWQAWNASCSLRPTRRRTSDNLRFNLFLVKRSCLVKQNWVVKSKLPGLSAKLMLYCTSVSRQDWVQTPVAMENTCGVL